MDGIDNDGTIRARIWRRFPGDEWAAFEQLPAVIRARMREHAYDPWAVNTLIVWRRYRRIHPTPERAIRAVLRFLDHCERLERRSFAATQGGRLAHDAACVTVQRYWPGRRWNATSA